MGETPTERDSSGRFVAEEYDSALDLFEQMDVGVSYTAPELEEHTGINRRTALNYLHQLHDEEVVKRDKKSERIILWQRVEGVSPSEVDL